LDIKLLKKCYEDFTINKSKFEDMYNYYCGNSKAMKNYSAMEYQESHKANFNFIKKMLKEEVAWSVATPVSYTSKTNDKDIVQEIDYYLYHWNKNHDSELLKNLLIYSMSYELYYIDKDGQFSAKIITPRNGYAYIDDFENVLLFMHVFNLKFDDRTYIDVYMDNLIYHFDSDFKEVKEPTPHIFNRVPVSIGIISEEKEKDTLYSDLKDIQDSYSIINSDGVNEITNTRQAIMVGKGIQLDEETKTNLKQYRFANLPGDKEASLDWLIKNLNPEYQRLMIENLKEDMYELSFHVNSSEKLQSNTSSLALRTRLINLESKTKLNNKALTNILINRIKFLFLYLKILKNREYDFRSIGIKFNSVIPSDDLVIANILSQLQDKVSLRTGLKQLSFIEDADAEIKQIKQEQEEFLQGQSILDNVGDDDGTE
jgi:SPP1 family phage portal protein